MCKMIVEQKKQLMPTIFTKTQINLLEAYIQNKPLSSTQKSYLYSTIKKKVDALACLQQEFYITGQNMIPERVEQAKQILKELGYPKAFISGSFLFKETYNDIDIFVVSGRRKAHRQDEKHITHILESDLHKLLFTSLVKSSVATFNYVGRIEPQSENIQDFLFLYQWIVNQVLEGEDQKELRDILLKYYFYVEKTVLSAFELNLEFERIIELPINERITKINEITKKLLFTLYSTKYVYNVFAQFRDSTLEMAKEYNLDNIPIFLNFAKEVRDECRRAES